MKISELQNILWKILNAFFLEYVHSMRAVGAYGSPKNLVH